MARCRVREIRHNYAAKVWGELSARPWRRKYLKELIDLRIVREAALEDASVGDNR